MTLATQAKKYLTEATATALVLAPTYATLEHVISGMSKQESQNSRVTGLVVTYIGLGKLISLGRDAYLKAMHVPKDDLSGRLERHDRIYGALFNAAISPPWYFAVGVDDPHKILVGTLSTALFGYFAQGQMLGYALDVSNDFMDLGLSPKTPFFLRKVHGAKRALVPAAAAAASFALTELAWNLPTVMEMYLKVADAVRHFFS